MSLRMVLGGIAEKMGSIVEFISGQSKITEANIEDTLKVSGDVDLLLYCMLLVTTPCCSLRFTGGQDGSD